MSSLLGYSDVVSWQSDSSSGSGGVWSTQENSSQMFDDVRQLHLLHHAQLHDPHCLHVHVDQQRCHHSHDGPHPGGCAS